MVIAGASSLGVRLTPKINPRKCYHGEFGRTTSNGVGMEENTPKLGTLDSAQGRIKAQAN